MKVERSARGVLLAGILTNATGIVINYSTSQVPGFIAANIRIAWVSLGVLTVALFAVQVKPWSREVDRYEPSDSVRRRYICTPTTIDNLPVSGDVRIDRLEYGEGPQKVVIDDLRAYELDEISSQPTERSSISNGGEPVRLPHRFVLTGSKRRGRASVVYIITDLAYVQAVRPLLLRSTFVARCKLDRGGILPFVDISAYHKGRVVVRSDVGAHGMIVAVEYFMGQPVARSRYIAAVRAGIRYPDDVWRSKRTGSPLLSTRDRETARVAFQSRQEGGLGSDVFVCDVDGGAMVNLTRKSQDSYDGLFRGSEEVAKWVDRSHLRIASHLAPQNGMRIVEDAAP
ncbi:hypothetical protein [Saccharothrix deserti]|uniref:hypothetical protein n=1 Tax=Saccharothrix deserti TaxID=2593674 RepID=UPI00131DC955|nr:hypothetical protein [Saccharothrix deserti]